MRALRVLLCAVAVLIVVAIGLLSLAAHRRPPQNTLLLHATQVRTPGNGFPLTYAWLTDRDAVFLWDDRRTILAPLHNPRWMKVDTVTGSTTPMPAMDQLFASTAPAFGVQANMISPDGKRALWIGTKNGAPVWHTARLDGSHLTIEPAQITTQMVVLNDRVAWASDSRHWIEVTFTQGSHAPNVHLNDADAPGASATIRPSGSFALDSTYSTHALGTVAGNRILLESTTIVKRTSKTYRQVPALLTFDPTGPSPVCKSATVNLPAEWNVAERRLSPRGDYIAWVMQPTMYVSSWLGDKITTYRILAGWMKLTSSLCVSRVDGSAMRSLGSVETQSKPAGGVWMVRWLPDGKRLSFLFENKLWTVPVD